MSQPLPVITDMHQPCGTCCQLFGLWIGRWSTFLIHFVAILNPSTPFICTADFLVKLNLLKEPHAADGYILHIFNNPWFERKPHRTASNWSPGPAFDNNKKIDKYLDWKRCLKLFIDILNGYLTGVIFFFFFLLIHVDGTWWSKWQSTQRCTAIKTKCILRFRVLSSSLIVTYDSTRYYTKKSCFDLAFHCRPLFSAPRQERSFLHFCPSQSALETKAEREGKASNKPKKQESKPFDISDCWEAPKRGAARPSVLTSGSTGGNLIQIRALDGSRVRVTQPVCAANWEVFPGQRAIGVIGWILELGAFFPADPRVYPASCWCVAHSCPSDDQAHRNFQNNNTLLVKQSGDRFLKTFLT